MITIRAVDSRDIARSVELWGQLGYAATPEEYIRRLGMIAADKTHLLLAATDETGLPVGMIHAQSTPLMADAPMVTIWSLVVDENKRNENIGAALLAAAESWAKEMGFACIGLASRTTRTRAHRFYIKNGYEIEKQSYWIKKSLTKGR